MCTETRLRARIRRRPLVVAAILTAWMITTVAALPARAGDDRRVVVNALDYPWSAIGRVNIGGWTYCTGFLVSERHVLTAGHCLYDKRRGRWHPPSDLHFVAAYQFDQILMHSPVVSYRHGDGRDFSNTSDLEVSTRDWAVLTLDEPIGRDAGWLGMMIFEEIFPERIATDSAAIVQAGYSAMRPHAVTVSRGCKPMMSLSKKDIFVHGCKIMDGDSGSPWLLYRNGQVYAAGLHVLKLGTEDRRYAGVLSFNIFSEGGRAEAREAFVDLDLAWGEGKKPGKLGPARDMVWRDLDQLLFSKSSQSRADSAGPPWKGSGISLADVIRETFLRPAPENTGAQ